MMRGEESRRTWSHALIRRSVRRRRSSDTHSMSEKSPFTPSAIRHQMKSKASLYRLRSPGSEKWSAGMPSAASATSSMMIRPDRRSGTSAGPASSTVMIRMAVRLAAPASKLPGREWKASCAKWSVSSSTEKSDAPTSMRWCVMRGEGNAWTRAISRDSRHVAVTRHKVLDHRAATTRRRRARSGAVDSRREALRAAILLSLAGWTIPGLLSGAAAVLFLPISPEARAYIGRFAAAFFVSWWSWAAITPAVRVAMRRVPLERPLSGRWRYTPCSPSRHRSCVPMWATWVLWLSRPPTLPPEAYGVALRRLVGGHFLAGVAAYASIVAVLMAMDERAARRRRELDTVRLEADLAQAQLRALQMQLQPHFLFNTLHGIAMLTDTDPAGAESMAVKLAELLRSTLRLRDVPEVALRTELELLRAYLEIEETRFGDRLAVTLVVPDDLLDTLVPSFLLQPIVENAVRHGVSSRMRGWLHRHPRRARRGCSAAVRGRRRTRIRRGPVRRGRSGAAGPARALGAALRRRGLDSVRAAERWRPGHPARAWRSAFRSRPLACGRTDDGRRASCDHRRRRAGRVRRPRSAARRDAAAYASSPLAQTGSRRWSRFA